MPIAVIERDPMAHQPGYINPWVYWSFFPAYQLLMRSYFRSISVVGRENIPLQGPMVFASKHFSRWDPLILGFAYGKPLRFMTDVHQFQGIQGWFIQNLGGFPVDRAKPDSTSVKTTIALLNQPEPLVIFPEGGIERTQPVRSLKPGLTRLVLQAEATYKTVIPIVPVALGYQPDAVRGAKVWVKFEPAITSSDFSGANVKAVARSMTDCLEKKIMGAIVCAEGF
jgi:1-acyl-sn-glycerol-3-phosphate acyltransferase